MGELIEHGENEALPYQVPATKLVPAEEAFVREYALSGDPAHSYRVAFPGTTAMARQAARDLLRRPRIQVRLREHQEAIANLPATKSAARMIHELEELVEADVNELIRVVIHPCLGCWPYGTPQPSPNPTCPACLGLGLRRVWLNDTESLSPGARRLYKGVECHEDGSVKKLLLHDQLAARQELHRIKGMHVDRSLSISAHTTIPSMAEVVKDKKSAEDFLESLVKK